MAIPHVAEAFTAEWLSAALGTDVAGVSASSLGEGAGLLGSLARLTLAYAPGSSGPSTLVAKFPATAEFNRSLARQYHVYEREYRFYTQVAAEIETRIPEVYFAAFAPETGDAAILLEDLGGRRIGDQIAGATPGEVALAVAEVSRLHAAWWERVETPALDWVPRLRDPLWIQVAQSFEIFWPNFRQNFGHLVTPFLANVAERFPGALQALGDRLCRPPITLIHGDLRLDNFCFDADGRGLTLLDWQLISRGRGTYDIAYMMCQSVEPDLRATIEDEVLRRYHAALAEAGAGPPALEELWVDYRTATLWCLMYGVAACGGMDLANERGVALGTAMASRCIAAIEHLGADRILAECGA